MSTPIIRTLEPQETYPLRQAVLWPDKPLDFVKVAGDAEGRHYGAFLDGALVAVISLFGPEEGVFRFRKFATSPAHQGRGVGTQLLTHVIDEARRLGGHTIWCDARLSAALFYQRFGMAPEGDVFHKGPIPYSKYVLTL